MAPDLTVATSSLIALGQVINTHAIHGELRLRLFNPSSTTLAPGSRVLLRRGNQLLERRVQSLRPHGHWQLVTLEGCDSMSAAEALVGYEVCVYAEDLPPAGAGEIYHHELVGMTVITTGGVELGTVAEVMAVSSNDICVVRNGAREYLVPLIADVVRHLDRDRRRLIIEPLPGLLDP